MATYLREMKLGRAWRGAHVPVAFAGAGLVIAALATLARVTTAPGGPSSLVTSLHVAAGVAFLVVGAVAALRRPRNPTGLLMVIVGLTWFIIDLQFTSSAVAYALANLFGIVTWGALAQLALAFPSGRLARTRDRVVVAAVYAWMVLGNLLTETFFAAPLGTSASVQSVFVVHRDAQQNHVANEVQLALNIVLGAIAVGVLVSHWRSATPPGRRALAPAMWSSVPIFAVVLALDAVGLVTTPDWLDEALPALTPLAVMTLPVAFLIGMMRSRLAALAVGHLVVELREPSTPQHLRDALARAVGDRTLAIAYRLPEQRWVDADGRPVELPRGGSRRSYTLLERDGQPIAALIHDSALDDDPSLVTSVAAAATLAIENERLHAEVRAQLQEVRASRARIVEAGDRERRRVQRDLHDGAQQRLVALALRLGKLRDRLAERGDAAMARDVDSACEDVRVATAELRNLSAGIHPAILTEAGLAPALQSLADAAAIPVRIESSPTVRLPASVEVAAYFVVSESLANIAKHAHATSAHVRAEYVDGQLIVEVSDDGVGGADGSRGSGLAGLDDRVAAVNGRLVVESPAAGGTRVRAVLPCA